MIKCYRKAWTIPDRVFDILARFDPDVELDVIHAIRSYSKFWDEFGCDDDFSYDFSSDVAMTVFYAVYDDLKTYNQQYFERCAAMVENAQAGVAKRNTKTVIRKRQARYYENHRDAINARRRERYARNTKNEKRNTKIDESVIRKPSDESTQSQAEQAIAAKAAIAHRINGLNKLSSLHSESLLGKRECEGEGPDYAHEGVDNNNPAGNLPCSEAAAPGCAAPVASKAVKGSKDSGSEDQGSMAAPGAVIGIGKAVSELSRRLCVAAPPGANNLRSAPHEPRKDEVLITKGWKLDFSDPIFYDYRRVDPFLKRGIEDWLIENKLGCSVEKRWIGNLIIKFAVRQGKLKTLMGADEDE